MAHSHRATPEGAAGKVRVSRAARSTLIGALVAVAVVVVVGLVTLWPNAGQVDRLRERAHFAAPGVTFPEATVRSVRPVCPTGDGTQAGSATCGTVVADIISGTDEGLRTTVRVNPEVSRSGLRAGDRIQLARVPPTEDRQATFTYWTTERAPTLRWLALAFLLLVVAVARLRGLMAVVGLGVSAVVVGKFVLPALLTGEPGTLVALCGCSAILYVVLYSTHGVSLRTSTALAGTLLGIGLTTAIGWYAVGASRLTGVPDESGGFLSALVGSVDFHDLLMCGLVIAGLGVLNDVTITQASAVWELRAAAPTGSRRAVFTAAMRIGRDHIASTIYTIVFAYAGSAIIVLLILSLYDRPILDLLSAEEIAEEVVRTLASAMGLVAAVPMTTAIASWVAAPYGTRADSS